MMIPCNGKTPCMPHHELAQNKMLICIQYYRMQLVLSRKVRKLKSVFFAPGWIWFSLRCTLAKVLS